MKACVGEHCAYHKTFVEISSYPLVAGVSAVIFWNIKTDNLSKSIIRKFGRLSHPPPHGGKLKQISNFISLNYKVTIVLYNNIRINVATPVSELINIRVENI